MLKPLKLYPFQQTSVIDARLEFRKHKYILLQLPTGAGKTVIFSEIISSAFKNDYRTWAIVPRKELLNQASIHLLK